MDRLQVQINNMENSIQILSESVSIPRHIKRVLFASRHTSDLFVNLTLVLEITTLIILCDTDISDFLYNSSHILQNFSIINDKNFMIAEIAIILSLQLVCNVSLVRISYLRCLHSFSHMEIRRWVVVALTVLSLGVDFMKTSSTLIYFRNKFAEGYNEFKLVLYLVNLWAVIAGSLGIKLFFPALAGSYLALYLIRLKFPMTDPTTNTYSQTLLLFGISIMTFKSIQQYITDIHLYYKVLGIVLIFSIHFVFKSQFMKQNIKDFLGDLEDIHKRDAFVKTIQKLIVYFERYVFREKDAEKVKGFLTKCTRMELPVLTVATRPLYLKAVYKLVSEEKEKYENSLAYLFILAQLEVIANKNIVSLIHLVTEIRTKMPFHFRSWVVFIEFYRLQEWEEYCVKQHSGSQRRPARNELMMEGFLENVRFIEAIIEAQELYAGLWSDLIQGVESRKELDHNLDRLIKAVDVVEETYEQLQCRSRHSSILYYSYLRLVHKNKSLKRVVKLDCDCSKHATEDCMVYDQTVFLCLNLNGEILHIGKNCLGLLGFDDQKLLGCNISLILPKFSDRNQTEWISKLVNNIDKPQEELTQIFPLFCVDLNDHLKGINLDFNIYLVDGQLRLAGSMTLNSNLKHIIAFKKTGQIVMTGNFLGECSNRFIQNDNQQQISKIIHQLEQGQTIQIDITVNYDNISDSYKLCEVVLGQESDDYVYIVGNATYTLNDKDTTMHSHQTIHRSVKATTQDLILRQGEGRGEVDKIEVVKAEFIEKYKLGKIIFRCILLMTCGLSMLVISFYFHSVILRRAGEKYKYIDMMNIMEVGSMQTVYFVSASFYLALEAKEGMAIPSFSNISTQDLEQYVKTTQDLSLILGKVSQNVSAQQFNNYKFDTKSYLIVLTFITNFDFILMDKQYYSLARYYEMISYTEDNMRMLTDQILPSYQYSLIDEISSTITFYANTYLMTLIVTIVLALLQGIVMLVFNRYYKIEMLAAANTLIDVDYCELTHKLSNISKFKNMLVCSKRDEKQKSILLNQDECERSIVVNTLPASTLTTHRELFGNMSPMPSFTPISVSINQSTAHNLIPTSQTKPSDLLEHQQKKHKSNHKLISISSSYLLYISIVILIIGISINICMYYIFSKTPQYPCLKYLKSFLSLQGTFYSYQSLHSSLFKNIYTGFKYTDELKQYLDEFSTSTSSLKNFQINLFDPSEFSEFRSFKNKLDFSNICTYTECQLYPERLNSTYLASATNSALLTEKIYNDSLLSPLTYKQLFDDYKLDFLVYSNKLYTDLFIQLMDIGLRCMRQHIDKIKMESNIRMAVEYGLVCLMVALDVALIVRFWREKERILRIMGLLREDKETELIV